MRPHLVHWLDGMLPSHLASALAPSWFTCVGLAGLATLLLLSLVARRHGLDRGLVASAVLWCYVAAVAAGILVPMAIDAAARLASTGQLRFRWAGMTSFWGYLAGLVAVAIVCRRGALPLARLGDLAAAPLGVALVCSRLGCFLGGCDYGKVTSAPWALRFPAGSPAWRDHVQHGLVPADRAASLPVHPTQLYEALLGLVIVGVALWAARRAWARAHHGRVFLAAAATYALGRIAIERFRGDAGRGIYAGLSSGQIFSILVLAAIVAGLVLARRRARAALAAPTALASLAVLGAGAVGAIAALGSLGAAHAQPAPIYGPGPAPTPTSPPYDPPPPPPVYGPMPAPAPAPAPGPAASPADPYAAQQPPPPVAATHAAVEPGAPPRSTISIGLLVGLATPINRRPAQVPGLGGPSVSIGYTADKLGLWLDIDSHGNADASHGTLLASVGLLAPLSPRLKLGARAGLGATLVNFDEPAFEDVVGTSLRVEALAELAINDAWVLWARPLAFDTLIADELGGPITTWQMRIGLAYRFGATRTVPAPAPAAPLARLP